jgi:hypothetical protein
MNATGCVGPFYPKIIIFYVLCPKGNLVFSLLLGPRNKTLEEYDSLLFLLAFFVFLRLIVVCNELFFILINKK